MSLLQYDPLELEAQQLFLGWTRHFRSQDVTLPYSRVETAHTLFLPESNVLLVGIIDAEGDNFFSEYKTANPRGAKTWKREWLLSTQALTYGLLTGGEKPFLVRKAFKSKVPAYDHEWYKFTPGDLSMWRRQIDLIAREIRVYEQSVDYAPWPMNIEHGCFAYGPNYPCPFWADGCTKHNFTGSIPGAFPFENFPEFQGENRAILESAIKEHPNALLLSKTRMNNWQRCRESYRRLLTMNFSMGDAAKLGSRFHDLVAQYNLQLIATRIRTK